MQDFSDSIPLYDRELSWLAFNERVLQEAGDPSVPLNERINFLAIFSSNLDEFFRVRVGGLRALLRLKKKQRQALAFDLEKLLDEIHEIVLDQQEEFGRIFQTEVLPQLSQAGVHLRDTRTLNEAQLSELDEYISKKLLPALYPIMLSDGDAPFLENGQIYLAVELWPEGEELRSDATCALVPIPDVIERFVELPTTAERVVMFLDDVIRWALPTLFPGKDVGEAFAIKLTRDADLLLEDEFSGDLVEKIRKAIKRRDQGVPSRFLFDMRMPHALLLWLQEVFALEDEDLVGGGRYHNLSDLWTLPRPEDPEFSYPPMPPLPHPELENAPSLLDAIREDDRLLHFPYQRYDTVVRLFEEAAADPNVEEVAATLYRVAKDSAVVKALISAAEAGKKATAFVEVKARFDEENNLEWAERMEQAGVRVHYSMPGLKVHSKLALFARSENGELRDYAYFGTGNFNEKTARIYADHALLTSDQRLTAEARKVFSYLTGDLESPIFEHLLVAPFNLRSRIEELIDREIDLAREGGSASMTVKLNALEDEEVIGKLYEASRAGVDIRLVVRGIFRAVAGIEGWSKNMQARSIVDRFLEHARVYHFENNGDEVLYLASADWMKRNLSRRIEVAFPIYDEALREEVKHIMRLQWADDTKARVLDAAQTNTYVRGDSPNDVRAQFDTYYWLRERVAELESA
ncbi:MAG: polyphosphate kinase 1 [Rubricoccaceae bacterium]|nr:polyphosphate kinase 1 [Rubricoccaceae bacterium]